MKERPILFSASMVRAILAGTKTQTRRVIKPQPPNSADALRDIPGENRWWAAYGERDDLGVVYRPLGSDQQHPWRCPYGMAGDRLWVRERAAFYWGSWHYFADGPAEWGRDVSPRTFNRPSIHMPRAASRITLEITGVRVEPLQKISCADAIAEGCAAVSLHDLDCDSPDPRDEYRTLWESINGAGSWDANPWIWVVEFKRATHSQQPATEAA